MVSWLRRVPGLLTLGWGRKPRSGHLPWACCPGQGVEKVDAGTCTFWSADFLLFAANRVLSGKRDRGLRGGKKNSLKVAFCAGKVLVAVSRWLPAVGSQSVGTICFYRTAVGPGTLFFSFREGGGCPSVPQVLSPGRALV